MLQPRFFFLLHLLLMASLLAGCAQLSPRVPKAKNHVEAHREQTAEMVEAFEAKRDRAQYEAAIASWRQGDYDACREQIDKLLARSPQHRRARLLRAEMRLLEDKPEAALPDLEALVADSSTDAEAIHLYGLVLEALDRPHDSLTQLQRAAKLDPQSEIYSASFQLAQETAANGPSAKVQVAHAERMEADAIIED